MSFDERGIDLDGSLNELTRERVPLDWALTQHNLGRVLGLLGGPTRNAELLHEGRVAVQAAWQVDEASGQTQLAGCYSERHAAFDEALETLEKRK